MENTDICLFKNYMCSFKCTDLYGDEDDVDEDSSQRGVAQNVAGIDDTHNKEHWGGQHEAPKQYCLKYPVAIAGQNINHLEETHRLYCKGEILELRVGEFHEISTTKK